MEVIQIAGVDINEWKIKVAYSNAQHMNDLAEALADMCDNYTLMTDNPIPADVLERIHAIRETSKRNIAILKRAQITPWCYSVLLCLDNIDLTYSHHQT